MSENLTFEQKQIRVQQIIDKLNQADSLSLKEVSSLYLEGKKLVSEMNQELDELKNSVENKIVEN